MSSDASCDLVRLAENEFRVDGLTIGQTTQVLVNGDRVAVYHTDDGFYATQDNCPHTGWPLSDGGELEGLQVTCALHGWCFDVSNGSVVRGIKTLKLRTYQVIIKGNLGHVVLES